MAKPVFLATLYQALPTPIRSFYAAVPFTLLLYGIKFPTWVQISTL